MILPAIIAFFLAALSCKVLIIKAAHLSLDTPNERSLHTIPTPRLGGVGILTGSVTGIVLLCLNMGLLTEIAFIGTGVFLVSTISLCDDFFNLSRGGRFFVHLLATGALIAGIAWGHESSVLLAFYVIATIWMINLYNFMDGMDGFSGGMALIGFLSLGLAAFVQGSIFFAAANFVVAAASAGFLIFNLPPAKIFMGDVGSATLGFLAAGFSIWGVRDLIFPLWFPFLIFSPFIVDATVTILRRAFNGEKIWLPHRKHFYQRLVLNGWSHRKTVFCEYILMLACSVSAFIMLQYDMAIPGLLLWVMTYLIVGLIIERHVNKKIPFTV